MNTAAITLTAEQAGRAMARTRTMDLAARYYSEAILQEEDGCPEARLAATGLRLAAVSMERLADRIGGAVPADGLEPPTEGKGI